METKKCVKCGKHKPTDQFYQWESRNKPYVAKRCKPCYLENQKTHPDHTHRNRQTKIKQRYGLTVAEWEQLRVQQNYRCAGCGIHENELPRHLDVAHDHNTGRIRGLLCNNCNTALARAFDNPQILRTLATYVS